MGKGRLGTRAGWFFLFLIAAVMGATAWPDPGLAQTAPLGDRVTVTIANERSSLNRRTRLVTSVADVTVANASSAPIGAPLHAVFVISSTQVSMPGALGGFGAPPYDTYYHDLEPLLGDGVLSPGEAVTFRATFVRNYRVRFTYRVEVYGPDAQPPANQPPVADAGADRELQLPAGESGVTVVLDGSGSSDPDGSVVSYAWAGTPDPADTVRPSLFLGPGTYTFTLTVTDDDGAAGAPDTVTVTVLDCPKSLFYADADGDGYGDELATVEACAVPPGYVAAAGDCDDASASVNPGAAEVCNGLDDDCDGGVDEGVLSTFFADADGDGYGDPNAPAAACSEPAGHVADATDCDDDDASVNPGGTEVAGNGIDENCDGVDALARPPVLSVGATAFSVDEGGRLSFQVSAVDPDGDPVTLTARPPLRNATFSTVPGPSATGTFAFDPDYDQQGRFVLSVTARDPLGLRDRRDIEITVNDVNRGPSLQVPPSVQVGEGERLTVPLVASDPDGDRVALSASALPRNAVLIPSTGTMVFTPDYDQAGEYTILCEASDGRATASRSLRITVVDAAPSGSPGGLDLVVNPVESPTLSSTARITGAVNAAPLAPSRTQFALVTGLAPAEGSQGQTLDVVITGSPDDPYATHFVPGQTTVDFGPGITVHAVQVSGTRTATARISIDPAAPVGARTVSVRAADEQSVAMVAFSVVRGEAVISGRLVEPESGTPVSGATVVVQGTSISGLSGPDGLFTLRGVPAGAQTLVVSAPDHELRVIPVQAATGLTVELGDLSTPPTVTDPAAAPTASVGSVLSRGIADGTRPISLDEAKQLVLDALVLVGGQDIGVKDAYGNELNPEARDVPFVSLGDDAVETLAQRMVTAEATTLGEVLHTFTRLWEWSDGPPNLAEWLGAMQVVVDRAWASPNDRRTALLVLLFNPGRALSPSPPTLVPDTPLNAFQAFLAEITLLLSASRNIDPEILHDQVVQTYPELAARVPHRRSGGVLARLEVGVQAVFDLLVPPVHADFQPTARAEQSQYTVDVGKKLMLLARRDVNPAGFAYTYAWTVAARPIGSTRPLLTRADQRVSFFKPDVSGQYTVRLVVTPEDPTVGSASEPYEVTITASDPCDAGFSNTVLNADASWSEVFCVLGRTIPVKIAENILVEGTKNWLSGGFPVATFSGRLLAAKQLQNFVSTEGFSHPASKISAARVFGTNYPDVLREAIGTPGKLTAFKKFAVQQAVSGASGFIEGMASQVAKDLMYAILDKMIDQYIKALRPSPPENVVAEVTENPWDPGRQAVVVSFERSPSYDGSPQAPGGDPGNIHYYYIFWRSSPGRGMTRMTIGAEGSSLGPHPDPDDPTGRRLVFLDPFPPEGQNSYYVQTRRIIGAKTVTEETWSEAGFWTEQFLNVASPPGANVYTYFKAFSDRAIKFLKAIKLQDSDLSEAARIYFPRPFERPRPPVSLATTAEHSAYGGGVLMGVPALGSVFRLYQTRAQYLFASGFKDPYQVGLAVDSRGYVYADNAASDQRFGGRIFRWTPVSLGRELFGTVQYYSMLIQLAQPVAVQAMTVGNLGDQERLFVADAYSNTVRELVIPPDGGLPPNPNHYVSQAITEPGEVEIRGDTSLAFNEALEELYVTAGGNIFRYGNMGRGPMFPGDARPFTSISGVAVDRIGNLYVADGAEGTVTLLPVAKLDPVFWRELAGDPAVRSLYTVATGLIDPGELRVSGDQRTLVFFDKQGIHQFLFGLSARLVEPGGAPLAGARVSVEDRGMAREAVTDAHGVFRLSGLQVPGLPSRVSLVIRTRDGRTGQAIVQLNASGHTVVHRLEFREVAVPVVPVGPMPPPPPPPPDIPEVDVTDGRTVVVDITVETSPDLPTPEPLVTPPRPADDPASDLPAPPYVALVSPVDGLRTAEAIVEVVGRVEHPGLAEATVLVSGDAYPVTISDRVFRITVPLREGLNTLRATVTTVDDQGRTVTGTTPSVVVFQEAGVPQGGALAGTVYDLTTGYAVPGALVRVEGTAHSAYTDGHGVWQIPELPAGPVKLVVVP